VPVPVSGVEMSHDPINSPSHYTEGRKYETIDVIEDWQLSYRLGNCVKYVSRAGRKDPAKTIEDLKKARWYLDREIATLEGEQVPYQVTYEDVLEDYAACAAEGYELKLDLEDDHNLWDPTLGPVEPIATKPDVLDRKTLVDYTGQAEWDSPGVAPSCQVDLNELHKDLDKFEENEVITTFERRGLIFGVDKQGRTYILGTDNSN
jgi:hypothetical protein